MVEENDQDAYWKRVEDRMKPKDEPTSESQGALYPIGQTELGPALPNVPAPISVPLPDMESQRGILMQWKKNQIDRQTALKGIQAQYDAQLEALSYHLKRAVTVSNARADRMAEEFLKKLDSEHIQILKDLGLRNAETRATALIEVRDMVYAKLKEVQTKKWPQPLVDRTIDDLIDLEKRVCGEMMTELGAQ
jgi:hypothetical protein